MPRPRLTHLPGRITTAAWTIADERTQPRSASGSASIRRFQISCWSRPRSARSGDKAARKAIEDNLPTAGLAILDFDTDDWTDIGFRRGKLAQFVSPKLL